MISTSRLNTIAVMIWDDIYQDLTSRRGIADVFDQIDTDTLEEINHDCVRRIADILHTQIT